MPCKRPRWFPSLIRKIAENVSTEIPALGLGHSYAAKEAWKDEPPELAVFPTKAELLQPGPHDGKQFRVSMHVCLTAILDIFDKAEPPHIDWIVPARYDDVLEGPRITIMRYYRKHPVVVHLFDRPPRDYKAVTVFEPSSGRCRLREV